MNVREVEVNLIEVPALPWQRRVDEEYAEDLAASVSEQGLLEPPLVRETSDGTFELLAGQHRLLAVRRAGIKTISVNVIDGDDSDQQMAGLAENLCRAQLDPQDWVLYLYHWKTLYEAKHGKPKRGGDHTSAEGRQASKAAPRRFAREAARTLKVNERTVEKMVQAVGKLAPEARQALKAKQIRVPDMLELAKLPATEQVEILPKRIADEAAREAGTSATANRAPSDPEVELKRLLEGGAAHARRLEGTLAKALAIVRAGKAPTFPTVEGAVLLRQLVVTLSQVLKEIDIAERTKASLPRGRRHRPEDVDPRQMSLPAVTETASSIAEGVQAACESRYAQGATSAARVPPAPRGDGARTPDGRSAGTPAPGAAARRS